MSWLFSQVLVAEFSAASCSDGEQSALLNVQPSPHPFWHRDRTMDSWSPSQFGLTCAVLTEDRGRELLTSFLAAFPAKTSAQQERAGASTPSEAGSGEKWRASFVKYDPATFSWRTPQGSLLGDLEEFSETWPEWGSMRAGECWEASTLEPPTVENASGLLPTPRASVGTHGICWKRAKNGEHRSQLEDYLGWQSLQHGGQVTSGRTVNADFQDWLMVWPTRWSALQPLETARFQQWQQLHGVC